MNNPDRKLIPRPVIPRQRFPSPKPRLPSPTSPLNQTGNRFISLSPYSSPNNSQVTKPTYSVLASLQEMPPSPYHRVPTTMTDTTSSSSSPSAKFEFHINPNKQVVKILEPIEEQKLNQGFPTLLDYIFPKEANFYTNDFQTREYYEAILVDSMSVQIRHIMKDETQINYSKVRIINVLTPEEWGTRPFTNKVLSCYPSYPGYNYYDYIEAWNKAFLYKAHFHTWFFHFSEDFSLKYPKWFVKWFRYIGIIPEVFPTQVLAGYNQFNILFKQENIPLFEYSLQFSAIFKLPWIMSFTHKKQEAEGCSPPLLIRQFSCKWWKIIQDNQASKEAVISYHQSLTTESSSKPPRSPTTVTMTNEEIARRIKSCGCNEAELARIINDIRSSPTPSLTPTEDILQDAQDPYEDFKLDD
nr:enzymatic polyprotein [Tanacetum cinerariifolium]